MRSGGLLINFYIMISLFALLPATSTCSAYNTSQSHQFNNQDVDFDEIYKITWGENHLNFFDNRKEVHLTMDNISGGAGFESKLEYASGFFALRMKIPERNSTGVVTTFYLCSVKDSQPGGNHDELDFEFMGSGGPNYTLQTNIYSDDVGGREQMINLWFDPTKDFHTYSILWNRHQVVFYVDNTPIRVFKNDTGIGVKFPTQLMQVRGSIWAPGDSWAGKIDWSQSPFVAQYRGFGLEACSVQNPNHLEQCYAPDLWWNDEEHAKLDDQKQREYEDIRKKYLVSNYCWHPSLRKLHKECENE